MNPKKVIIDTDPGIDDAMALLYALKSPELDVLAITTVAGNSTIENTTRNARYLLEQINLSSIPVYSGAAKPLVKDFKTATVHGKSGLQGIDPKNEPKLTNNADEKIIEIIEANPNEVTIIALGPLTNVAKAFKANPETMSLAKGMVIMGGAIDIPGNMGNSSEFNLFVDPEAADIVFRSPIKKMLVPLDACNKVTMCMKDVEPINSNPAKEMLAQIMKPYAENIFLDTGIDAAIMYDPLTIFCLLRPNSCRVKKLYLSVNFTDEALRGKVTAESKNGNNEECRKTEVVLTASKSWFKRDFIDSISNY